jgi:FixJ family two-component response regulator
MPIGRPVALLSLMEEEREGLERLTRRATTAPALAQRARIILACAEGKTNTPVAAELRLAKPTVGKWRARFVDRGWAARSRIAPRPSSFPRIPASSRRCGTSSAST